MLNSAPDVQPQMKVRVSLVADVSGDDPQLIACYLDRVYTTRRASIVEMREFFRRHGIVSGRKILNKVADINTRGEEIVKSASMTAARQWKSA